MPITGPPRSIPLPRLGKVLALLAATLALALPAGASGAGFTARLLGTPTHQPRVGRWPITVTATRGRQKLSGSVSYQFLYQGQVVSRQPGRSFRNGVCHDTLLWPKRAVGHTITLRIVVKTRYGTDYLNWWIKVRS
jgi:hypothetical protein